jgi:hypothetical protein
MLSTNRFGDQIVAIKVLNNGSTPEERATLEDRFIREVNMMCKVKHDNLVKVRPLPECTLLCQIRFLHIPIAN